MILAWFSGAKKTISFEKRYSKLLLTHVVNRNISSESNASKAIEHRMALLKPLGIDFNLIAPKIFLSDEEISIGKQKLVEAKIDKATLSTSTTNQELDHILWILAFLMLLIERILSFSKKTEHVKS